MLPNKALQLTGPRGLPGSHLPAHAASQRSVYPGGAFGAFGGPVAVGRQLSAKSARQRERDDD